MRITTQTIFKVNPNIVYPRLPSINNKKHKEVAPHAPKKSKASSSKPIFRDWSYVYNEKLGLYWISYKEKVDYG